MPLARSLAPRTLDRTWAFLAALTLASGTIGLFFGGRLAAEAAVLAIAVAKGRRLCLDFLGLRRAPPGWGRALTGWAVFVALAAWGCAAAARLLVS